MSIMFCPKRFFENSGFIDLIASEWWFMNKIGLFSTFCEIEFRKWARGELSLAFEECLNSLLKRLLRYICIRSLEWTPGMQNPASVYYTESDYGLFNFTSMPSISLFYFYDFILNSTFKWTLIVENYAVCTRKFVQGNRRRMDVHGPIIPIWKWAL